MDTLQRLAELAVVLGANVQPGQVVRIAGDVEHVELVRAVAGMAYRRGARFVDVALTDRWLNRARVLHADHATLTYAPAWPEQRIRELDDVGGASVEVVSPPAAGLYDDLAPTRVIEVTARRGRAWREVEYRVNNTIVACPTETWALALRPHLAPADALAALWADAIVACRLNDPDPVAAWRRRIAELATRAKQLTALKLDTVHLHGPGTDLIVGVPPTARWEPPSHLNERGIEHVWNLPSEEVYTVPDRNRVDGHIRLTSPAVVGGRLVDGVTLTFESGRVVSASGGDNVDALRSFVTRDPGAARLGELALVDEASAVGTLKRTFGLILWDENRASHIALGFGFPALVEPGDRDCVNESMDHLDLTVGSDELNVTGVDLSGRTHDVLLGGAWALDC